MVDMRDYSLISAFRLGLARDVAATEAPELGLWVNGWHDRSQIGARAVFEACGWVQGTTNPYEVETGEGPVRIDVWRYER